MVAEASGDPHPTSVSIIMAVRNEARFIGESLGAVLRQNYPPEWMEILVADGESEDRTREIIESMAERQRVRILSNPRRIQAAGLNEALRVARGDVIIRVDGHVLIEPDYVLQCVRALAATQAQNVGGCIAPVGITRNGKAIAAALRCGFAVPGAFHTSGAAGEEGRYTDTVYLGAWPREVLERVGGYDERLATNEDYDLNYRIRRAGGRVYLQPAIRSVYYGRQTLPALARQYFRYGYGKMRMLWKYPNSLRVRHLAAPVLVVGVLAGLPFALAYPLARILWLSGLGAYIVADLGMAARAALREGRDGWRLVPGIALTFPTIHWAWGLGFWVGLCTGWIGRRGVGSAPASDMSG